MNNPTGQNTDLELVVRWTAQLFHESGASRADKDFDLIRSNPGFQATVLDLGFPSDPFMPR